MAKVLLVEDDNNLREIYQARLMAEGYDIIAAQNGEEALVVAKQNKPDLIISDVMMPRISGFEMLDILRNTDELKHTKVIMLTALGQTEDQKRADSLGADKYLVKSQVTLEDIVNAAKELLGDGSSVKDVPPPPDPRVKMEDPLTTPAATQEPVAPATSVASPTSAAAAAPDIQAPTQVTPPVPPVAEPTLPPAPAPAAAPISDAPVVNQAAAQTAPEPPMTTTPVGDVPVAPEPPVVEQVTPVISMPTPGIVQAPISDAPVVNQAAAAAAPDIQAPTQVTPPVPPVAEPTLPPAPAPAAAPISDAPVVNQAAAAAAVSSANTQTIETEEAAVQAQIQQYSEAPNDTPPAEIQSNSTSDTAASNDSAIADAVQQLNASSNSPSVPQQSDTTAAAPTPDIQAPVPPSDTVPPSSTATRVTEPVASTPVAAPAVDTPAATATNNETIGTGRKVIQPISSDVSKPNMGSPLAREDTQTQTLATPVVGGGEPDSTDAIATPPMPPHTPGQSFDPNIAL